MINNAVMDTEKYTPHGLFGQWLFDCVTASTMRSLRALSSDIGITDTMLSRHIRGDCYPTIKSLNRYCKYFGASVADILPLLQHDMDNCVRENLLRL